MSRLFMPKIAGTVVIALVLGSVIGILSGCKKEEPEKMTVAVSMQPLSAPVYVAHAKGFFESEGLQAVLQPHTSGRDALAALVSGRAEFATVAETPVMFAAARDERICIVATIADSRRYMNIVARKDRGIAVPHDLEGKRIGVSAGTTAEYYLFIYLTFNGIAEDRVRMIGVSPERMTEALVRGEIDAAVTWPPYMIAQQRLLGSNAVTLSNESIYKVWWNIAAGQDFAKANPETVKALLRALLRAERYIKDNPAEASRIVARFIGQDPGSLGDYNFDVQLGQALILDLEDQARWAIRNRLIPVEGVPNFLRLLCTEGLEAVAPGSVMVTHK
ncbi:MAG: ABC transporter substrate-binding protein [Nitrospirota bacterium]